MAAEAPQTPEQWFAEGLRCFRKPDGVRAVAAFEQVLELDPGFRTAEGDTAYFYLGKISEVEGRLDAALEYYTQALTLIPGDEESLIGRGACLTVLRRHHEAVADFRRVLGIPPAQRRVAAAHILYAIAENYRQLGDFARALEWGRQALAQEPRNARHRELVADMQRRLEEDKA
jgi:tetratricopeptide (TPR) repeat protein